MLGTRTLAKPSAELPFDLLLVGAGGSPPEVLAHEPNPAIEEIEREPKRSGGGRRGSHARNCNAAGLQQRSRSRENKARRVVAHPPIIGSDINNAPAASGLSASFQQ